MATHLRIGFDTEFVRADVDAQTLTEAEEAADSIALGNEVLCYTAAIRNLTTNADDSGIIRLLPKEGSRRHRCTLTGFLSRVLDHCLKTSLITVDACRTRLPDERTGPTLRIDLVAHFSRADLCGFQDFDKLKSSFDSVRGTFCTLTRPLVRTVWVNGRHIVCTIRLYDSMLLAPAKHQSLAKLGDLMGFPKLSVPDHYKQRMDLLRDDDPALFTQYAIRDAEVAERWIGQVHTFFEAEFGFGDEIPVTLASAGVKIFREILEADGIEQQDFLGGLTDKGRFVSCEPIQDHLSFIANAYHGGRNEAFWLGLTPETDIYDIDVKGAYSTAMAMLGIPDWEKLHITQDLNELAVVEQGIAIARVRFAFPPGTRYPSLPVRTQDRGLIYPLTGETHCTGPELVVARNQGAQIDVQHGILIPYRPDDPRQPFLTFSKRIAQIRAKYKGNNDAFEQLAKDIGNSAYGKTAQAVDNLRTTGTNAHAHGRRVFDARSGKSKRLPPSAITSPPIAAQITGLVRALCSECIASIPEHRLVFSITTDGWLSDAPEDEINTTGPVAQAFMRCRQTLNGSPDILEVKHGLRQGVVTKTRGTFTVKPMRGFNPVLARAGQRLEQPCTNDLIESQFWLDLYRSRHYDLKHVHNQLISLRDQWSHSADLIAIERSVRVNLEYDFKRRLIQPRDQDGMLTADTRPWHSVNEFNAYRDDFEHWRRSQRRCCVTEADRVDFERWRKQLAPRQAAHMTARSNRPPLVQNFLRAWCQRLYGLPGGNYKALAEITNRWWPTTTDAVKQAARRNQSVVPVSDLGGFEEIHWIYAITNELYPYVDWFAFVDPFSHAAAWIFGRNIDWWEQRLTISDVAWSALTDCPSQLRHDIDEGVVSAIPPYSAKYTSRNGQELTTGSSVNPSEKQDVADGVLCSDGGTQTLPLRNDTHHFAEPSVLGGQVNDTAKAALGTDAIMPSIVQLSQAAGLSRLKQDRLMQAAEKDLRHGRVQVPLHIPATHNERLKWAYIQRLVQTLGEDAFDRAVLLALTERNVA